jgi:hypothetical protein
MQEDAAYARSLQLIDDGDNSKKTRASKLADSEKSQQMSSVNTRENLQMRLDLVTPLSVIEDSEEDDQPIKLNQLEELEEVIYGQPYQPDQYSQANITFHGSAPEGSPAEISGEDSD